MLPSHYVQVSGQESGEHIPPEKRRCIEDNPEQDAPLDFSVRTHHDKFFPNNWVSVGTTTTVPSSTVATGTMTTVTSLTSIQNTRTVTTAPATTSTGVTTASASTMTTLSKTITNSPVTVMTENNRLSADRTDEDVWRPWW